ncbi:hypothetical protein DPMN_111705 [Dreissena polymorpha]|uniref:Uncharacterized protein n=1 Tax=Dreissena polymorpha TaxID=45954 RepID=A0A9D4KEC3_DREPO|nr:hypothetical protein DPMN_111705 [Dreissena polymorpha]
MASSNSLALIMDNAAADVKVWMANVSDDIWNIFKVMEIVPAYKDSIFLTIDDATRQRLRGWRTITTSSSRAS